ncbi:MAG: TfoX/Sxy family protein [Rhizobiales bacterium]|nr:TfoX/Sxy family protein [Hyphomicrobiales bacterium]
MKTATNNLPVSALPNLGPKSALMLAEVGIRTIGELRAIGAVRAYARVKESGRKRGASLNMLWSLAAGLDGRGWQDVSEEEKERLASEYRALRR